MEANETNMATDESPMRPNIRIEIQNNLLNESMEVDDDLLKLNSEEDGEISDDNEQEEYEVGLTKINYSNVTSGTVQESTAKTKFSTGVNIFYENEREKLQVRAERFGINPEEVHVINDVQLQKLHDSLGITAENEKNIRFEAIHMNGTEEMSSEDVFTYFEIYSPNSIEWVNDASCNIVWNDTISAARALLRLSKSVIGMPMEGPCNPISKEIDVGEKCAASHGRSILLIEKNVECDKENGNSGSIHISDITVPVPPGYWRLGEPTDKSKFLLLRYAHRTDKKPMKAERFSKYYKKYGNPNFGGLKGLISQSKKKKLKGIFDRHEELKQDESHSSFSGNPWGSLAKNWNKDNKVEKLPEDFTTLQVISSIPVGKNSAILKRLGHKHAMSSDLDSDSDKTETKKSKIPRMRMYADEEEEKIKHKKCLKLLGKADVSEKSDLRSKLNQPSTRVHIPRMPDYAMERQRNFADIRTKISKHEMQSYEVDQSDTEQYSDREISDVSRHQQKSKVTVIIKKQHKPTVASTVWSRMNDDNRSKVCTVSDENSDSDNSTLESKNVSILNREKIKAIRRPGFNSGSLKSRLGIKTSEHKSPLRIEINNDHFKAKSSKK